MNIPNLLSLFRIVLVPAVVILLIQGEYFDALICFGIAGITDALDGALARLWHQQTVLGAYLDPAADKALLASCFITLSIFHVIPGWLTVLVISRDLIILSGILVMTLMEVDFAMKPAFVSKVTTTLQIVTVLLALAVKSLDVSLPPDTFGVLYGLTALFTIASGAVYIVRGIRAVNHVA